MARDEPRFRLDLHKTLAAAQLPALPPIAIRLLELSRDPNNGPAEFARPIEADPGLASQVLRFVNSSYFGFTHKISNLQQAIALLGTRAIKNFTLWNAVFAVLPNPKYGSFDLGVLWQDSLRRALFARAVAEILKTRPKDIDDVFAAALLQDMAVPILAAAAPPVYARLLELRKEKQARLSRLEEQVFGWNHAKAAGAMARQWKLPQEFVVLVESHLAVERLAAAARAEPASFAVALSSLLPSGADPLWSDCQLLEGHYQRIADRSSPGFAELLERIDDQFAQFAPLLRLSTPSKSLKESLCEATAKRVRERPG
jgi:HD-like signal output (HDOD) protein